MGISLLEEALGLFREGLIRRIAEEKSQEAEALRQTSQQKDETPPSPPKKEDEEK